MDTPSNIKEEIRAYLFAMKDDKYSAFQRKLIPNIPPQSIIGVRTPILKKYAESTALKEDAGEFLSDLPHRYFDENQLHAFILSGIKDFDKCIEATKKFLPFIDNWATCDQLSPKCFKKNADKLLPYIKEYLKSRKEYTLRFGIGLMMRYFLDENFKEKYIDTISEIKREEYYVKMMQAWYIATALAKQYESAVLILKEERLDVWTHNKAIQKACESFRISQEKKVCLRTLKRK
ncbi:MAG: DNA alkylation repair protein [Bacteroidales bacterium]|nr:DNA alkylation repair protein [Bacteroidales bacterium]